MSNRRRVFRSTMVVLLFATSSCTTQRAAGHRTDVPEPAVSPALQAAPAGRVVPLAGEPEGIVVDGADQLLAVGVRHPDGVVLASVPSGQILRRVALDGAPRHLAMAGPRGPVIAPAEGSDTVYQLALPSGDITASTKVGRQPHDAATAGGHILVGNELADTVSVIDADGQTTVVPAPLQPGGVAASMDATVVIVVGVRGRQVEAMTPNGQSLGRVSAGVGPTHVRAGAERLFFVADTEGDAVLVFDVGTNGPRQVGRVATGGTPYGLAVDPIRRRLYVTLTKTNELRSFRISGSRLTSDSRWPTVRQPNDVAVDQTTGQVVVTGTADGVLEFIDP